MASIIENIEGTIGNLLNDMVDLSVMALMLLLLFVGGYILGSIVGGIARRVLRTNKLQELFVKYGAMTSGSWSEITGFLGQYVKWLIVIFVFASYYNTVQPLTDLLNYATTFLVFIVLLVVGWILAGVLYKMVREIIENMGIEKGLKKYGVADALGGMDIPHISATLAKIYVFLLFVWIGVSQFEELGVFENFMEGLMGYIPGLILGLIIIIVSLIVADFAGDRLKKKKKAPFAAGIALVAEVIIVIFGVTLALPKFGFEDIEIIKWSFLIIVLCLGIGLAIAMGLGLKDSFARVGKKYEKEI
ncbi:hypothetical protein BEH94_03115 [Candidatus Altiarchaeales archaeon WOR_SM1_SCG]|nr:hypothetical protein BEH94_03115 [Candidatus Altiarchaeales archaeon WOR_SM1_SCG]